MAKVERRAKRWCTEKTVLTFEQRPTGKGLKEQEAVLPVSMGVHPSTKVGSGHTYIDITSLQNSYALKYSFEYSQYVIQIIKTN